MSDTPNDPVSSLDAYFSEIRKAEGQRTVLAPEPPPVAAQASEPSFSALPQAAGTLDTPPLPLPLEMEQAAAGAPLEPESDLTRPNTEQAQPPELPPVTENGPFETPNSAGNGLLASELPPSFTSVEDPPEAGFAEVAPAPAENVLPDQPPPPQPGTMGGGALADDRHPTPGDWQLRSEDGTFEAKSPAYDSLASWLRANTLSPDTLVSMSLDDITANGGSYLLMNALVQAAYSLGRGTPFAIRLPAARDAELLVFKGGISTPYGMSSLVPMLYALYHDIRAMFIAYQAEFPVRILDNGAPVASGVGEVLLWKLKAELSAAKAALPELSSRAEVPDVLAAAIEQALKDVFSGLAPRDEVGRCLQDPARLSHAREALRSVAQR